MAQAFRKSKHRYNTLLQMTSFELVQISCFKRHVQPVANYTAMPFPNERCRFLQTFTVPKDIMEHPLQIMHQPEFRDTVETLERAFRQAIYLYIRLLAKTKKLIADPRDDCII